MRRRGLAGYQLHARLESRPPEWQRGQGTTEYADQLQADVRDGGCFSPRNLVTFPVQVHIVFKYFQAVMFALPAGKKQTQVMPSCKRIKYRNL